MRDRYIYRWGFVWKVQREDFRAHHRFANPIVDVLKYTRFYPGQIIECDEIHDLIAMSTYPMLIRKKSLTTADQLV
jgi:hypothetical protein